MNEIEFENTVRANAPFDKGALMGSIIFEHNPYYSKAIYDDNILPYIRYQNEGFIHWITKKPVTVNVGFIENKTVGAINRIIQSSILGLPYSYEETNRVLANRQNEILTQQGVIVRVR